MTVAGIPALTNAGSLGPQVAETGISFVGLPMTATPPLQHDTTDILIVGPDMAESHAFGGIGYESLPFSSGISFMAGGGLEQADPAGLYGGNSTLRYDFDVTFEAAGNLAGVNADAKFNVIGDIPGIGVAAAHWEFNYLDPETAAPYIIGGHYDSNNGLVTNGGPMVPGALTGNFFRNIPGPFSENIFQTDLFVLPTGQLCAGSQVQVVGFFEWEVENQTNPVFIRTLQDGDPNFEIDFVNGTGMRIMPGGNPSPPPEDGGGHPLALSSAGTPTGDFNSDCLVNDIDIDLLRQAILNLTSDAKFNLDGIGDPTVPDSNDFTHMIEVTLATAFGDGNLNQIVNFEDFVFVSNNFNAPATGWATGNYNLDTLTNFQDFVLLSNNFGTDLTSPSAIVPEAASGVALFIAIVSVSSRRVDRIQGNA